MRVPSGTSVALAREGELSPAQHTLVSLLELAYGAPGPARVTIEHALVRAGRRELPTSSPEIMAFVRTHLLSILTADIGPRLTIALLEDLVAQLEAPAADGTQPSLPPVSMPRRVERAAQSSAPPRAKTRLSVLLVDANRAGRAILARALVRVGWDVTVVDSLEEVPRAAGPGGIDLAILDLQHESARAIIEALAQDWPDVIVVARTADATRSRAFLADTGLLRFDVRSRDAPAEELIEAVRRMKQA